MQVLTHKHQSKTYGGGYTKITMLIYCHLSGLGAPEPTGDGGLKSPTVGGRRDRDGEYM